MTKPTTPAEASAPRRRRADAERSVAAILDTAVEALAGDPDASMAGIARRAGLVRRRLSYSLNLHGKEGVDGSSPSEGSAKNPESGAFW